MAKSFSMSLAPRMVLGRRSAAPPSAQVPPTHGPCPASLSSEGVGSSVSRAPRGPVPRGVAPSIQVTAVCHPSLTHRATCLRRKLRSSWWLEQAMATEENLHRCMIYLGNVKNTDFANLPGVCFSSSLPKRDLYFEPHHCHRWWMVLLLQCYY